MNLRGFSIKTALIFFFLVTGCGLGLGYLYQQTQILTPLQNELGMLPSVKDIHIAKGRASTEVRLQVGGQLPLGTTMEQVRRILGETGGVYTVELVDNPNQELLDLYAKIRLAVEEAIMTGEFSLLEERIESLAKNGSFEWELSLDRDYIYLELAMGENNVQRVIARGAGEGRISILETGQVMADG